MHVLLAEDDDSVASALERALAMYGHEVDRVAAGSDVLLRHHERDVVLLDLGLPDGDGLDVLRKLRLVSAVPVIVITARADERSVVRGLRLGADDYLVKPVRLLELLARLEAVTRRGAAPVEDVQVVEVRGVTFDFSRRCVRHDGHEISFTTKEFDLVSCLARRVGVAVSRQQLLDEVWGDAFAAASRSVDVHLSQIRSKLPYPDMITNIRGFGYRLEAAP